VNIGLRPRRSATVHALRLGAFVFVVVLAIGELIALAIFVARGGEGSILEHAQLGWLYVASFHAIPLDVAVAEPGIAAASRVTVPLLLPTLAAVWWLYGAGRAVAREALGSDARRVAVAVLVAVPYAALSYLLSLVVQTHVALAPAAVIFGGPVDVSADEGATLILTFAIAVVPVIVGAVAAVRRPELRAVRRLYAAVAGGVRAFWVALLLAFVGLLVNAGADPAAARAYFDAVAQPSYTGTAILIGHHVLALPNQSIWVLVPAMGGSDELRFDGSEQTLVSYGETVTEIGVGVPSGAAGAPLVRAEPLPRWYVLFLLVPGLATLFGGRRAAEIARSLVEALALGSATGIAFAGLVVAGAFLSTIAWEASAATGEGISLAAGPDLSGATLLALAWGIVGGALGALWRFRAR
jgi:hypothetical protein